jgi:hypothetical protein
MKSPQRLIIVSVAMVGLQACSIFGDDAILTREADNNPHYEVSYLFEFDGCKVYRFYDNCNYVYFTNCSGEAISISSDSTEVRSANLQWKK